MKLGRREKYQPIQYCWAGCLGYPVHTCHLPIDIQQIYCSAQTGQLHACGAQAVLSGHCNIYVHVPSVLYMYMYVYNTLYVCNVYMYMYMYMYTYTIYNVCNVHTLYITYTIYNAYIYYLQTNLWFKGSNARVATHYGSESAGGSEEVEARVMEEGDWCGVIFLTQRELH